MFCALGSQVDWQDARYVDDGRYPVTKHTDLRHRPKQLLVPSTESRSFSRPRILNLQSIQAAGLAL
jgi:hypothetical protein